MAITTPGSAIVAARRALVPVFCLYMSLLCFLDRSNISFAKSAFQTQSGVSLNAYALGASLFFLSYAVLEIPGNLITHRVGADHGWRAS